LPADGDEVLEEDVLIGLLLHLLDVGAGGERLVAAGQHQATNAAIGLEAVECLSELAHQIGAQRVQSLRSVETDDADPAFGFGLDVLVGGHDSLPAVRALLTSAGSARNRRSSGRTARAA